MTDRPSAKSRRGRRRRSFVVGLKEWGRGLFLDLSPLAILTGVAMTLVISALLVGYEFQSIPDFQIGDIADRIIEARHDFTVRDEEATLQKKQALVRSVAAVFDFDLRVNHRKESQLRGAFAKGRKILQEEQETLRKARSKRQSAQAREQLLTRLSEALPEFNDPGVLQVLLSKSFSPALEEQLAKILQESMEYPGVIWSRDVLLRYRERGIRLRDSITGQEQALNDWMALRDLGQARDVLRQNEFELTAVSGEEKRKLIRFLEGWIVANVSFNETQTLALEGAATSQIDPVFIQVKKGRRIVRAGDEIKAKDLMVLTALKQMKQPRRLVGRFAGIFLIAGFFLFALWQYFRVSQMVRRRPGNHFVLLGVLLLFSLVVTKLLFNLADLVAESLVIDSLRNPLNLYLVAPLAFGAILIILLVDAQVSIIYSLIFSIFVALLTGEISLFIYTLTGSLAAIYVLEQYRERFAIIRAGLVLGIINVVTALALQGYVISAGSAWTVAAVRSLGGFSSGLFAAMLASLLLPILEALFEITTDIKLLELSNLNSPPLRRLAVEAPGTYHHSIIVGTLAESAAEAIGANPLLVRVGAYYHDIGKLKKPEYYVENQIYSPNKHESLSPSMSSLILASHVRDGLSLADEIDLVKEVRDLIPEHHGTKLMTYFYQKAKDVGDEKHGKVDENDYRYPGPKPQSKEAAILMLADQVEAAARTLQDPTPGQARSLIRRLVQSTIQDGQFDECDITISELEKITRSFERAIASMHHHRIQYPGFDFSKQIDEKSPADQRIQ